MSVIGLATKLKMVSTFAITGAGLYELGTWAEEMAPWLRVKVGAVSALVTLRNEL
jgi:hypothetical protein